MNEWAFLFENRTKQKSITKVDKLPKVKWTKKKKLVDIIVQMKKEFVIRKRRKTHTHTQFKWKQKNVNTISSYSTEMQYFKRKNNGKKTWSKIYNKTIRIENFPKSLESNNKLLLTSSLLLFGPLMDKNIESFVF